ncbi:MAG: hypothetical protein AAFP68_15185 [Pseudomonadota bacterium]
MKEVALIDTKSFWDVVSRTGVQLFHADRAKMMQRVDEFTEGMAQWSETERLLFYNDEPLYVAADLLDIEPDAEHHRAYTAMVRNMNIQRP